MHVTKNVLNRIDITLQRFQMGVIDIDLAIEKMIDIIEDRIEQEIAPNAGNKPGIDLIKYEVARFYGIDIFNIESHSKKRIYAEPRQVAMYLCTELCDTPKITLKAIGAAFGGRDHSTVLHSKGVVEDDIFTSTVFKEKVAQIKSIIISEYRKTLVKL